jgi:hypothetical protein
MQRVVQLPPLNGPILIPFKSIFVRDGVWEADRVVPDRHRVDLVLGFWHRRCNWRQALSVDEEPVDVLDGGLDSGRGW